MKNKSKDVFEAIGIITAFAGLIILVFIASPLIGWLTGHVVRLIFGNMIANGLNLLFNTTRFVKSDIPIICATLALIGSFFKTVLNTSKNK